MSSSTLVNKSVKIFKRQNTWLKTSGFTFARVVRIFLDLGLKEKKELLKLIQPYLTEKRRLRLKDDQKLELKPIAIFPRHEPLLVEMKAYPFSNIVRAIIECVMLHTDGLKKILPDLFFEEEIEK
jgi:hypothetical protein